jgi:hypothetical protein
VCDQGHQLEQVEGTGEPRREGDAVTVEGGLGWIYAQQRVHPLPGEHADGTDAVQRVEVEDRVKQVDRWALAGCDDDDDVGHEVRRPEQEWVTDHARRRELV